jgi:hypothetical protein
MTKFSTQLAFKLGLTILSLFMRLSYSNMCGSDYLLQENKMEAFLLPEINAENIEHFNPGVEIVHVIAKKNSTRLTELSSTPGCKSALCNRPLSLQFLRGITMRNMCPHFYVVREFRHSATCIFRVCLDTIY